MSNSNDENRRARFRLRLPGNSMLKATIGGMEYQVVEIAELSMVVTEQYVINQDGSCSGNIHWSDGRAAFFTGQIGRICSNGRVIEGISGITTHDIIKEQRLLLKRFPTVINESSATDTFKPGIFNPDVEA